MSKLEVEKKAATALSVLKDVGLPTPPPIRVVAAFDVSGSMSGMFSRGDVQKAFDQLLGAALKLDDDGNIDAYIFHNTPARIATADAGDYGTFVKDKILNGGHSLWGGTSYAPIFQSIVNDMFGGNAGLASVTKAGGMFGGLFGAKPAPAAPTPSSNEPVMVFFITDGECDDSARAEAVIKESLGRPIYWNMVGLGGARFPTLEKLADKYDNTGFIQIRDLRLSDEAMYRELFTTEFVQWVKKLPTYKGN